MENLDDFLKGEGGTPAVEQEAVMEPAEAVSEDTEAEASAEATEAKVEQPRGPDGKFLPKGEKEEGDGSPPPREQQSTIPESALIGERRRRQEAEQRVAEYEARLAALQQQPAPDQFEDPEGWANYLKSQAVQQAVQAAREEAYQTFQTQRIAIAAEEAKGRLPDYGEKIQVFEQMAQVNPALLQELYRAPNPAEYAYNTAKTQIEISQFGGLEGLIKARVQEALKAQAPVEQKPAAPIPDTLADAQSSRGPAAPLNVPTLDEILKR